MGYYSSTEKMGSQSLGIIGMNLEDSVLSEIRQMLHGLTHIRNLKERLP